MVCHRPQTRDRYLSATATDGVHALSMNYIELKFGGTKEFHLGVRCERSAPARFSVLTHLIHAELSGAHLQP